MLTYEWVDSINSIDSKEWDEIFRGEVLKSHAFFMAEQKANLKDVSIICLKVIDNGRIIAIVPCFKYRLDMDVLSPKWIKHCASHVRKIFPSFLRVNILGVGSIAATCEQHIGIAADISDIRKREVWSIVNSQIETKSRLLKANLILLKEVPQHDLQNIRQIFPNYSFYDSLPNSFIPTEGCASPYPEALKRHERRRYKKTKFDFDKLYVWDKITDFGSHSEVIEQLYLQVLSKSKNKFEQMNSDFFKYLNEYLKDNVFVFFAKKKATGEICVVEIVIVDRTKLIPIYIGIDYSSTVDVKTLYFSTIFRVIKEAESLHKSFVVLGQTSYYPKVLSGALVERLYLGFYSTNKLLNLCIKHIFRYMFAKTKTLTHVYSSAHSRDVLYMFENHGFTIDNR